VAVRLIIVAAALAWVGLALLLSQFRWFSRPSLANRLRPFVPGGSGSEHRAGLLSAESFRDVIAPLAQRSGAYLARMFGVSDELDARLRRFHSPLSVAEFRTRQFAWTMASFGAGLLLAVTLRPHIIVALFLVVGPPLLAFLLVEQQAQGQAERWTRRIFLELPIVTEQLGMLLSAGYSLGGALNRLAERSHGAAAQDLRRVTGRIRQGLGEMAALREWADLVELDALDRLVSVLSLNREAADLGHLISEEARSMRAEAHRELIETIEKRAQMVWIPVTIATLLPGVIFIAIPFTQAMDLFTGPGK
jgi:tight adherence protein C